MNKKERKRFTVNIPQYMWEIITRIHEESPSITENGTMLTILEKGINWYQKKWKQKEKKAETVTPGNESAQPDQHQDLPNQDAPVDHENNTNSQQRWQPHEKKQEQEQDPVFDKSWESEIAERAYKENNMDKGRTIEYLTNLFNIGRITGKELRKMKSILRYRECH